MSDQTAAEETEAVEDEAPLLEQLAELEAEVREATEREERAKRQDRERTAHLTSLHDRRLAHAEQVGAGERDPDPEFEARCERELTALGVKTRTLTPYGTPASVEVYDVHLRWTAEGATRAREQALGALRIFCRDELDGLHDELMDGYEDDEQAMLDRLHALAAALKPFQERDSRLGTVYALAGVPANAPPEPYEELRWQVARVMAAAR